VFARGAHSRLPRKINHLIPQFCHIKTSAPDPLAKKRKHLAGEDLSLRAACIYGPASMINHACYPNVARFDYFDRDGPENLKVHFRALTDLEAGTELRMNYLSIL